MNSAIKKGLALIILLSLVLCGCGDSVAGSGSEAGDKAAPAEESTEAATGEGSEAGDKAAPAEESTEAATGEGSEAGDKAAASEAAEAEAGDLIIPFVSHQYIDRYEGANRLYYSKYDLLSLRNYSNDYPELEKALSSRNDEIKKEKEADADARGSEAKEWQKEMNEEAPFYTVSRTFVKRADKGIFSFVVKYEDFLGGAHGMNGIVGYNYYPETGEEIPLSDVIKDNDLLNDVLSDKLKLKYPDIEWFEDLKETFSKYGKEGSDYTYNWVLENQGITFFFNPYEIAAYAYGRQTVTIPYDEVPGLFTEKIKGNDGQYVIAFDLYDEVSVFDGDGSEKILNIDADYDYDSYGSPGDYPVKALTLYYDGKELKDEDSPVAYAYQQDMYLVHTGDGRNYVYIDCYQENDWHSVISYELSADGIKRLKETNGSFYVSSVSDDEVWWHPAVFNQEKFELQHRADMLSTVSSTCYYRTGKDGNPEPYTNYFTITSETVIKSVRPLRARYMGETEDLSVDAPEVGGEDEHVTELPAKTGFRLWRTDNESYVDCVVEEDGKHNVYRLIQETDKDYNRMIDGVNIEDCFEELFWAG